MQVHIEPSEPSVRGGEHLTLAAVVDTGAGPYSFRWNCACPGLSVGDTYGGSLNVTVPLTVGTFGVHVAVFDPATGSRAEAGTEVTVTA